MSARSPTSCVDLGRGAGGTSELTLAIPRELVDAIAERAAAIVLERLGAAQAVSPWLHGQRAIAEYLALPLSTVEKLTAAGALPVYRLDGGRRLSARRDELDEWARGFRDGPAIDVALRVVS